MGSGSTEDLSEKPKVVIHTDGACSGNPGPGGWGVILQSGQHRKELKGGEEHTTNNRMELMAERHHIRWHWVKGHHGHDDNERADELAREGMAPFLAHRRRKTDED
jgi:ribonuclease HI